jgi:hypothetical protein
METVVDENKVGRIETGEPHLHHAAGGEHGTSAGSERLSRETLQELLERLASGKHARQSAPPGAC